MVSGSRVALQDSADPKGTDRGDQHHEHLAERDRVVEFKQNGDRRDREAEELAKPAECCHRNVLRLGVWKGIVGVKNRFRS